MERKTIKNFLLGSVMICTLTSFIQPCHGQRSNFYQYRTYNGIYNDLRSFHEGKAGITFKRKLDNSHYKYDGHGMMPNENARVISNLICNQDASIPDEKGLSSFVFTFLQFIDHDITATAGGNGEFAPIPVPAGDVYFDPLYSGYVNIPFTRSGYDEKSDHSRDNTRQQVNEITAWLDGSVVYGSDEVRAKWLRSGECGKLKVSTSIHGDLLPCNTVSGDCDGKRDVKAPEMAGDHDQRGRPQIVFVAGDVRANEQPGLTALHTLFVREHNRICDELVKEGKCNDEKNYQYARKIVGGLLQSILYNELLPILGIQTGNDRYRRSASPDIFNTFATAAFRLGHTMVTEDIPVIIDDCGDPVERLALADAFFNPSLIQSSGIDGILRGLHSQTQEKTDVKLVHGIRNFLFGPPGSGGLDLAALNIQRGRDHGIPPYNEVRSMFGLPEIKNWNEITTNFVLARSLKSAYKTVDQIDAWVGMLAEDHMEGKSVGPTLNAVLSEQFRSIKIADRFYYTRDRLIKPSIRREISQTRLADVIRRNTSISDAARSFFTRNCHPSNDLVYCLAGAQSTRFEWINEVHINGMSNRSGDDKGYGNYTNHYFQVEKGGKVNLFLRSGYKTRPQKEYWKVWLDVNLDGQFSREELVYHKREYRDSHGSFKIPVSAKTGMSRLRIAMSYYRNDDPCEMLDYGEVEDYGIEIMDHYSSSTRSTDEREKNPIQYASGLEVYPNPTAGPVTIRWTTHEVINGELILIDQSGRSVMHRSVEANKGINTIEIETWNLNNGMYRVIIKTQSGTWSQPLLVID